MGFLNNYELVSMITYDSNGTTNSMLTRNGDLRTYLCTYIDEKIEFSLTIGFGFNLYIT